MKASKTVSVLVIAAVLVASLSSGFANASKSLLGVARLDASCTTPLVQETVTTRTPAKKNKKSGKKLPASVTTSALICWQEKRPDVSWKWTTYSTSAHTPFTLPATSTWRRISEPPMTGLAAQAGINFAQNLTQLAADLDYYWIEIDIADGYKVTAPVWAPRGRTNLPVIVHFHGTGGLVYWDYELAARLASSGYVIVAPTWYGPRRALESQFSPSQMPGLFENPQGIPYFGANLDLVKYLLPVLRAAGSQPAANAQRIAVQGQSRGGTIALLIAATTPEIKAVAGLVPPFLFSQLNNMTIRSLTPPGWETLPRDVVTNILQPTLVIYATQDELVPTASSLDFQSAAVAAGRSNIQVTPLDGPHTIAYSFNTQSSALVRSQLLSFYARNL